ncbi:hypothetical protein ACIGO9_03575 [Nocardia asteroides]|uniref:hypothetical protein n=1 Tax=Nocardia asteroides TaxID=1824 RepID=UPI0037C503FE
MDGGAGRTADQILDDGDNGLEYFENYLPLYRRCFYELQLGKKEFADKEYLALCARYDAERGMDIAAIERMSTELRSAVPASLTELQKQQAQRNAVQSVWQGEAGEAAFSMLSEQVRRAEEDYNHAVIASRELGELATALRTIVTAKASDVKGYWRDPGTADFKHATTGEYFRLQSIENAIDKHNNEYATRVIDETFIPQFEATVTHFEQICTEATNAIQQVFKEATTAMAAVEGAVYPAPEDAVTPDDLKQDSPVTKGNPSGGGATTDDGGTTTDTGTTSPADTTTTTAASTTTTTDEDSTTSSSDLSSLLSTVSSGLSTLSSVVSELSSLASSSSTSAETIAETIGTGLTSVGTAITSGIEQLSTLLSSNTGATEIDIAGTKLSLGTGEDGQLKLTTTDAAGTSHEYGLTVNENGIPVVTDNATTEGFAEGESTTAEENTTSPTVQTTEETVQTDGTGRSGYATAGVNQQGQQSETEHWAPTLPVTAPDDPPDSGAHLAEAGPL